MQVILNLHDRTHNQIEKHTTRLRTRIFPLGLYNMSGETSSTSSTKRPAEPGPGPEVQPQLRTGANAKRTTLRISGIPIHITKEYLSKTLEGLAPLQNETTGAKHHRVSNIHFLSLAPSASTFDSDKYQVATVTFKEIPSALAVSNTDTTTAVLEVEGEEIEVDIDMHFRGLTPLNHASNPSVEYVGSYYLLAAYYEGSQI